MPEGEVLQGREIEARLVEKLQADGWTCLDSLWSLSVLYSQSGHLDQAIKCISRILELTKDPEKRGGCLLALGQIEEKRKDFEAAIKRYRAALAVEPGSQHTWYFIHNNLGYSLNQVGEPRAAIEYLQTALKIDPARPNAYKNLALSHQSLGNLKPAVELFIAATQANATDTRSLAHLEDLVKSNPSLETEIPDLRFRMDACRKAVQVASVYQPGVAGHLKKLRDGQRPRWWEFWKRRPRP